MSVCVHLWSTKRNSEYQQLNPQGREHRSKIMKPPQRLPLPMAERLRRAQPDSVANHVTARSISDWRALT